MRKNFVNENFTYIDPKKGFDPCCNSNVSVKKFLNLSLTDFRAEKIFDPFF